MKVIPPDKLIAKFEKCKGERSNFENNWQECYEYCLPRKDDVTTQKSPGEKRGTKLLDNTAINSAELLAGALHSILCNPFEYFIGLSTGNLEIDGKDAPRKWLQLVTRKIHDTLASTNFQTEVAELFLDLVVAGNACQYTEEDKVRKILFKTIPLKQVYVEENSKGFVDVIYRYYELDARGCVDEFGEANVSEKMMDAYNNNKKDKFCILHAVYPRAIAGANAKDTRFAYISQYVDVSEKKTIMKEGYNEFPYFYPRWSKASGENYGRGCGEKALPSAKMLNAMRETTIKGAQKVVDPPLQAPDDGFIMSIDTKPAGISFYRAGSQDRIEPIFNDSRIDYGFQSVADERIQVREAFYVDQLKLREGDRMTTVEVQTLVQQAFRFLGPIIGRLKDEYLVPLTERTYNMLDRQGEIPDPPAELQNVPIHIQFSAIASMMQVSGELKNIGQFMAAIAPFMSIDPTVGDNINGDAAAKYIARSTNFPQEIMRDSDSRDAIRQQKAQMQQQAMQAEQGAKDAESASKVISAASKFQPKAG